MKTDVLLAACNGESYIREMLESLANQTLNDYRVLIRDDGSSDGTLSVIKEYCARDPEKFVLIEDGKTIQNAAGNFFELLKYTDGDYIFFADQDDIWLPDKIESGIAAIQKQEKAKGKGVAVLSHSDLTVVDADNNVIAPSFFALQNVSPHHCDSLNRLLPQNTVTGCTIGMNRGLKKILRTGNRMLMHDWWIALTAAAFGSIVLSENRIRYRQHDKNEVGAKDVRSASYVKRKLSNTDRIRASIQDTYEQAQSFLDAYKDALNEEQKEALRAYAGLGNLSTMRRAKTIKKYGFYKTGRLRRAGQILYGGNGKNEG